MGLIKGLLKLADDLVSIPTDIIGLTNHHNKEKARRMAREAFVAGKIDLENYNQLMAWIDAQ